METKLEQIAVKAVNQLPKSVVREIRTLRSVGTGGGRLPPVTRWAASNGRPYRDKESYSGCRRRANGGRQHIQARHRERQDDPAWSETLACADAPLHGNR